jgi:hypothetical protein
MNRSLLILLVLAFVGCGGRDLSSIDAGPPPSSDGPAASSAPAPEPSGSPSAVVEEPPAHGAPPLTERGAGYLAADLSRRLSDATHGVSASPPPDTVVDGTFVILPGDPGAPIAEAVDETRRTAETLWSSVFLHRPEKGVIAWVASSPAALAQIEKRNAPGLRDTALGAYDPDTRQLFVATSGKGPGAWGTWNHEIVHPLLEADFPLAPAWLMEGLPALFEVEQLDADGSFQFGAHFRLQTVRTAMRNPALTDEVKLDALFTWVTDPAFREHEALHYSIAREALRWLHGQGLLWPWYAAFRDGVLDDPSGIDAFKSVVHMTPAEATESWRAWLRSAEAEGMVPAAGKDVTP